MNSRAFEHGVKLAYTNQYVRHQAAPQHQARPRPTDVNAPWHTPERAVTTTGGGGVIGGLMGLGYGAGSGFGAFRGGLAGGLLGAGLAGGGYALANIAGR